MHVTIIELRTGIGNGNNFTSNHLFGHVMLTHTALAVDDCARAAIMWGCYVGFFFPRVSSGFLQTAIAREEYPRVLKIITRPEDN